MLQQNLAKSFGKRLKYWREKRGFSKLALHRESGVTASSIRGYETGYRVPRLDMLEALLDALEVDIGEFFAEEI